MTSDKMRLSDPNSKVTVLLGLQWGDEGKGKLADALCEDTDFAVRYQGGHNAGHTVFHAGKVRKLHLLPCGSLRRSVHCVIAEGVVLSLDALLAEVAMISDIGPLDGRLSVGADCPLLLPSHRALDEAAEKKNSLIGTTRRGIGPAYEDFYARRGLLLRDAFAADFYARITELMNYHNFLLKNYYGAPEVPVQKTAALVVSQAEEISAFVTDTAALLRTAKDAGKRIFLEGAQGCGLDPCHGTYPFVTASYPSVGGALIGSGLSHKDIDRVLGVIKVYATRVGAGPFLTEQKNTNGESLQARGKEFGTTTGRKRRCGWLDLVDVRRTAQINGTDALLVTKADVFDDLERIRVCTEYAPNGEPIYRDLPGWRENISDKRTYDQLPARLHDFISLIKQKAGVPVLGLSVGPRREQLIPCQ